MGTSVDKVEARAGEPVTRREFLKRVGFAFAGALVSAELPRRVQAHGPISPRQYPAGAGGVLDESGAIAQNFNRNGDPNCAGAGCVTPNQPLADYELNIDPACIDPAKVGSRVVYQAQYSLSDNIQPGVETEYRVTAGLIDPNAGPGTGYMVRTGPRTKEVTLTVGPSHDGPESPSQ